MERRDTCIGDAMCVAMGVSLDATVACALRQKPRAFCAPRAHAGTDGCAGGRWPGWALRAAHTVAAAGGLRRGGLCHSGPDNSPSPPRSAIPSCTQFSGHPPGRGTAGESLWCSLPTRSFVASLLTWAMRCAIPIQSEPRHQCHMVAANVQTTLRDAGASQTAVHVSSVSGKQQVRRRRLGALPRHPPSLPAHPCISTAPPAVTAMSQASTGSKAGPAKLVPVLPRICRLRQVHLPQVVQISLRPGAVVTNLCPWPLCLRCALRL